MDKLKNNCLTFSALSLLAISVSSFAQQTENNTNSEDFESKAKSKNVGIETIVVTSTRKETSIQETPIAVTALSAADLSNRNIADIQDVARFTPSLSVGRRGNAGGSVSIRGMGVDALESSAAVGTYIDDVYFASSMGNVLGFMDAERVEVLRGPQGTLFGRNTIAGAIQYITKAPTDEFEGNVNLTLGNFGKQKLSGAINLPVSDTFQLRVAAQTDEIDGYVYDEFSNVDRGSKDTTAARIRALWTPTDSLTVNLKAEHLKEETNGRPALITDINPNAQFPGLARLFGETRPYDDRYISSNFNPGSYRAAGFNGSEFTEFEFSLFMANITYDISDNLSFKSISSYAVYESKEDFDVDGTPLSVNSALGADDENKVFTQELQLSGELNDSFSYTLGAYYYDSEQTLKPNLGYIIGFAPANFLAGDAVISALSYSVYGQASYNFTDDLKATLGYRYTKEKPETFLINETDPLKFEFSDTSPYIGLDYAIDKNRMLYAKASKGFRAGGFTPNRTLPGGGISFDPETAWTYEMGARLDLFDGRLRLNPTIFQTDWENIQFLQIIVSGEGQVAPITDNAGDGEIKGFELDAEFAATENLKFRTAMSLLDSKYTRVEFIPRTIFPFGFPGPAEVLPNLFLDTDFQRAPKQKYTLGANYTYLLANDGFLIANIDYNWVDEQSSGTMEVGTVDMPSYGLLSARLQYDSADDTWSAAIYGNNINNQYYIIGGQNYAEGYTAGADTIFVGRPREYGVEFTYNF